MAVGTDMHYPETLPKPSTTIFHYVVDPALTHIHTVKENSGHTRIQWIFLCICDRDINSTIPRWIRQATCDTATLLLP